MIRQPLHDLQPRYGMSILAITISLSITVAACGKKKSFELGDELGPAVLGGGGATRSQGSATIIQPTSGSTTTAGVFRTVTKKRLKAKPTYNIVPVTQIIEASDDRSHWSLNTLPFLASGTTMQQEDKVYAYGSDTYFDRTSSTTKAAKDGQWPFAFDFDYPVNNFQFKEAHLIVETQRDNSDTEGIFIEGVFSGRPPGGMINTSSTAVSHHLYQNVSPNTLGTGENQYYIDWSLAHYRRDKRNSFDLNLSDLLQPSGLSPFTAVQDGRVQVVLGDDSPAYSAYLVVKGLTISSDALQCTQSSSYSFKNALVHNDGNTISQAAFTGTVRRLDQAWSNPLGQVASEFYFDTALPNAKIEDITISTAKLLLLKVKRDAGGCPMIVINGIGVSNPSCDRSAATSVVESWDDAASTQTAWANFLTSVPTNATGADIELDLLALLGADKVRSLLKQGKLNVALAGTLVAKSINGSNALTPTSARGFQAPVDGPELIFDGQYSIEVCSVVNDPDSPMTEGGFVEPAYVEEYEEYQETVLVDPSTGVETASTDGEVLDDGAGPVIASLQVQDITSTSATIYWTSDEPSSSQVSYGINSPSTSTNEDTDLVTFHKIVLSNLSAYKYYKFQVTSKDRYGNASVSDVNVFTTLR